MHIPYVSYGFCPSLLFLKMDSASHRKHTLTSSATPCPLPYSGCHQQHPYDLTGCPVNAVRTKASPSFLTAACLHPCPAPAPQVFTHLSKVRAISQAHMQGLGGDCQGPRLAWQRLVSPQKGSGSGEGRGHLLSAPGT